MHHARYEMREVLAHFLVNLRSARAQVNLPVPAAAFAPVAHALLEYFRRPPSRYRKAPISVVETQRGGAVVKTVNLEIMEDIGWVVQLEASRPGHGFAGLVHSKGLKSDQDMLLVGPPFQISCAYFPITPPLTTPPPPMAPPRRPRRYTEPKPRADNLFSPGTHSFNVEFNVWGFNGLTGALTKLPGEDNKKGQTVLVEHAKNILRGREAWGLRHALTAKWAQLPLGTNVLKKKVAMPGGAKKRRPARPSSPSKKLRTGGV